MNKKILITCLMLLFSSSHSLFARNKFFTNSGEILLTNDSDNKEEIDIDIEKIPASTHGQPRSLIKPIECYVSELELEFYFNFNMGNILIQIFDETGFLIDSRECNTLVQSLIYLNKPSSSGKYTIKIAGDQCRGQGVLIIRTN